MNTERRPNCVHQWGKHELFCSRCHVERYGPARARELEQRVAELEGILADKEKQHARP